MAYLFAKLFIYVFDLKLKKKLTAGSFAHIPQQLAVARTMPEVRNSFWVHQTVQN